MPLIYSFVARATDRVVLAEYSSYAGNFHAVASEVLGNMQRLDERFTVAADKHTFNFLTAGGFVFLAVADEAYGRQIPFAYLQRVSNAWLEKYAEKGLAASSHSFDRSFGPVMKREMEWTMSNPEAVSKVASVQRQVDEVKGIMVQNIEQVLARGDKLDVLVDQTDNLRDQAQKFQKQGTMLRKRMWWQNWRMKLLVCSCFIVLAVVIFLAACFGGGHSCVSKGDSPAPSPPVLVPAPPGNAAAAGAAPPPGGRR